jgi:hypothetical protein
MSEQKFYDKLVAALNQQFDCNAQIDNWLGGGCSAVRIPVANGIGASDDKVSFLIGREGTVELWDYEKDEAVVQEWVEDYWKMPPSKLIAALLPIVKGVFDNHPNLTKKAEL